MQMIKFGETLGVSVSSNSLSDSPARSRSCGDLLGTCVTNPGSSAASGCNSSDSSSRKNSYRALPRFCDVPRSEKQALFVKKLELCCVMFDFTKPAEKAKEKKIKRQTLEELVEFIETFTKNFMEAVISDAIRMVSANLFRVLNSVQKKKTGSLDFEDEEPYVDPSWPHLELVYQFLLKILNSRALDTRMAMGFVDDRFILQLLDLFNSEDPRERESSKAILHRIYSKFTKHRPFIKRAIENLLFEFIYETEKHNGIVELLEIIGSIITGFVSPLKEEHKLFLVKVLIPLHKPNSIKLYHEQLSYCIMQYIEKDFRLAETAVSGILKYWPVKNSPKQVLFLKELEEILEAMTPIQFDRCKITVCQQMARCLNNFHFQVSERVLFFWKNYHIERLMEENMEVILPILYSSLERNAKEHWSKVIQKKTQEILRNFSDHDQKLFAECRRRVEEDKANEECVKSRREAKWKHLEKIAASRAIDSECLASQPLY